MAPQGRNGVQALPRPAVAQNSRGTANAVDNTRILQPPARTGRTDLLLNLAQEMIVRGARNNQTFQFLHNRLVFRASENSGPFFLKIRQAVLVRHGHHLADLRPDAGEDRDLDAGHSFDGGGDLLQD